jgi:hypothetical protein
MKIGKTILGVVAGVALSGSTMAQSVAKETRSFAKNETIAKVMEHIKLPKKDTADAFVATFQEGQKIKAAAQEVVEKGFSADSSKLHYDGVPLVVYEKAGEVSSAPKSSIKIIDLENRQDITKEINDIDSTIIKDGGIDMAKVDSLESVLAKETKNNLSNNDYENVLDNQQEKQYDRLVNVKKKSKAYKQMQKENIVDSLGNINPVDSMQVKSIQAKMKTNAKRDLLTKLAYPDVDVMVKTRSIKKLGKDLYQQAEMNFLGDIKTLSVRGKAFLDTINPKAAEAKTKFENPICGKIGIATTDSVRIIANTCEECSTPAIKPQRADSVIVRDLQSSPFPAGQITVDSSVYKPSVVKTSQPEATETVAQKGESLWGQALKTLGPTAPVHKMDVAKTAQPEVTEYVSQNGESLWKKASRMLGPMEEVYNKEAAKTAQPAVKEHVVQKGETFWGMASKALGPKAKNRDIAVLKNEMLSLNNLTEQQAKYLKINSVVKLPVAYAQVQSGKN